MTDERADPHAVVPRVPLHVRARRIKGSLLVLGYEITMELAPPADFIWLRIDGATSVAELADQVTAEFAVDRHTALEDVGDLVRQLTEHGLLELVPPTGTGH